jgi:hypothetical protein
MVACIAFCFQAGVRVPVRIVLNLSDFKLHVSCYITAVITQTSTLAAIITITYMDAGYVFSAQVLSDKVYSQLLLS